MKIGYFLSCEEYAPTELLAQARRAEEAGFEGLWISDHYHPWIDEQGESAFVWSMIGALSQVTERIPVTTGVTCPTMRIHPAVIAQAAATSQVLLGGRFRFGVGSGEALNEHILGTHWPEADVRLEMLEEAIEVIRGLWEGGQYSHRGRHYTVENARIYTLPESPPPIYVSGFGPKSVDLAARIGDGYVTTSPDDLIQRFRDNGGGDKVVQAGTKVCYGPDRDERVKTMHRLWPNEAIPGELAQVLPNPAHFEQAAENVTEEMIAESVPCGPDLDQHVEMIRQYADAGVDELYLQQVGGLTDEFFDAYAKEILPRFR
ncbi:MAG TPA: LLM class F420-dependent oxidoreductase [Capillimicrobium sp.]|nr:LLM class F420-dependent oxidoreductase [Capillimicrobium sp.]